MAWFILLIAGLLEVVWALTLKYSDGMTKLWPSLATLVVAIISLALLSIAMRSLPVGTAYGVWVGIGALGTAVMGVIVLGETAGMLKIMSVMLILAGIVGLKISS